MGGGEKEAGRQEERGKGSVGGTRRTGERRMGQGDGGQLYRGMGQFEGQGDRRDGGMRGSGRDRGMGDSNTGAGGWGQ